MSRPRRWVWYFSLLALLGAFAVVAPVVYNLRIQLTPEQLAEARRRWQQHGPADYNLELHEKVGVGPEADVYLVKVRRGRVVEVSCNGKVLTERDVSAAARQAYGVPGLFDQIEGRLDEDLRQGPRRSYATASFEKRIGYPLRYVRRVRGSKERLEWNARLLPAE